MGLGAAAVEAEPARAAGSGPAAVARPPQRPAESPAGRPRLRLTIQLTTETTRAPNIMTTGQSFGEAVALVGARFPVSAEAVTAARLLRVPAASLRRKMQADPDICIAMLASTLQHLRLLVDQIEQLKAQTGAQRVAEFLLSLAQAESGPARVELPYDKSLLAGRLGMKPESLSRAFLRLKASGVTVEQAHVAIAELGRLRDLTLQERTVTRQR